MLYKTHASQLFRRRPPSPASSGRWLGTGLLSLACLLVLALPTGSALAAQPPVGLGTADSFAVLAGSEVTNTGPSVISGNVGVSPGTAVTGFPPGQVNNGTIHSADAVAAQAQSDLTTAYNDAAGRTPAVSVSGDLGGLILTPGVYKSSSSLGLTGAMTLDAQGDPNAVFIFQVGSTLTTASGSRVNLVNGAQACNVYWQIGSSATLGTSSVFVGNILALTSISLNDDVTVSGRALARNGAVTMINDRVTAAQCAAGTGTTPGSTAPGTTPGSGTPGSGTPGSGTPGSGTGPGRGNGQTADNQHGTALLTTRPRRVGRLITRFGTKRCVRRGFRVVVTGLRIDKVVFTLNGRRIARRTKSPFHAMVRPKRRGIHIVRARITYTDGTPASSLRLRYRSCAKAKRAVRTPSRTPRRPGGFTG